MNFAADTQTSLSKMLNQATPLVLCHKKGAGLCGPNPVFVDLVLPFFLSGCHLYKIHLIASVQKKKKKPVRGLDNLVIKDFWQYFSSTRVRIENVLVHFFVSPVYIPSSTAHCREVQDLDNTCLFSPCKSLDVLQFHNTSPC